MTFEDALIEARVVTWWVFGALVAATLVLHALAALFPTFMIQLHSVPWAFHVHRSVELRYQSVLYAAFHVGPWARVTHISLAWDQLAWFALFWSLHPLVVVVALALLLAQAVWLGERRLATVLCVVWCVIACAGWLVHDLLGDDTAVIAAFVLSLGGVLRASGHLTELVPPGVGGGDRFKPIADLRPRWLLVVMPFIGLVSEFAAGLPHRLFLVQVLWVAERLGLECESVGSWPSHADEARRVHEGGWRAAETTAWMANERE